MPPSIADKLKENALPLQQKKLNGQEVTLSDAQLEKLALNHFLSAGIDFKGQLQSAYQDSGGGLEVNASFDPGRIFGVLSTEVGVTAGATRSNKMLIIAQRGPNQIHCSKGPVTIDNPLMINCLKGVRWEGKVSADLFIGVAVDFSVGSDQGPQTQTSWNAEDSPADSSSGFDLESMGLGIKAEAKAGFAAEAGYTYEHFYAEDLSPLPFQEIADVRDALQIILNEGEVKAIVKKSACKFLGISYQKSWWEGGRHVSSKKICDQLATISQPRGKARKAKALMSFLSCWADVGSKPKIPTSILISTHTGDGSAGLKTTASFSASVVVASASAEATAEALKIEGKYKSSKVRYQAVYPAPYDNRDECYLVMTQDTKITYKQIDFSPLTVGLEVSISTPIISKEIDLGEDISEIELIKKYPLHNSMSYTTCTVFWDSSPNTSNLPKSFEVNALEGTGISFGQSVEFDSLIALRMGYYDEGSGIEWGQKAGKFGNNLAQSLNITLDELRRFLDKMEQSFLSDLKGQCPTKSILLESSFSTKSVSVTLVSNGSGTNKVIGLSSDTTKQLLKSFKLTRKLESIRMRYRLQDLSNDDSDGFSLGFKIFGTGVGIKLKNVDQSGSEGIVDLHTEWMDNSLVKVTTKAKEFDGSGKMTKFSGSGIATEQSADAYEKAVPPVALLCQ